MTEKIIEVKINKENDTLELWLFGRFEACWDTSVDVMEVIVPHAIRLAIGIGKRKKEREIRKVLGVNQ